MNRNIKLLTMAAAVTSIFSTNVLADWQLIADFEGVTEEDFNVYKRFPPQGDMFLIGLDPTNPANGHYYVDPGPQVDNKNNQVWNAISLPAPVEEGAKASVKFDVFFYETGPSNFNIGLSDFPVVIDETLSKENGQLLEPNNYGAYEAQIGINDGSFNPRNGNGFANTEQQWPVGEWFTVYILTDNGSDTSQFYFKTAAMTEPEVIVLEETGGTSVLYRNGTTDPLVTLNIAMAASNDGPVTILLVDNIYIDYSGFNLDGGTMAEGESFWGGYKIENEDGDVDTGDWMGWLSTASAPYIFSYDIGWMYMPEPAATEKNGAWAYFFK